MVNWYTADTHFGHENVIPFCGRPFRNSGHMDTVLIKNMWSVIKPEDDLWIIGDFAFGPKVKDTGYLEGLFGQLPGARKHLIIGNHDGSLTQELPWDSRVLFCSTSISFIEKMANLSTIIHRCFHLLRPMPGHAGCPVEQRR